MIFKKITFVFVLAFFAFGTNAQWQFKGSPAFSAGQVQYNSLAVDAGVPYVAYRDLANLNKCSVMKYDGISWVNVGPAGFSAGGAQYTSLAFDGGYPFVAYVDGASSNRVTVKAFNGVSWITIGVDGFSGINTSYVNLKFDGTTAYVAYQDGSNSNKLSVMKFDGANWVQVGPAGFSPGVASEISLTMLGSMPYVSFKDASVSDELSVMYFDGANWQNLGAAGITTGGIGKTSISNDGTGIFVAFIDAANSNKLSVMTYNGSWNLVGTAGFTPGAADYIDLEFSGTDPYVSYQDASYGFRANVMWFDGTGWLEVGIPGFTPSQALYTSLAFEGGYPMVAFQDYDGGSYKASVMKYEPCFDADLPTISLDQTTICKNMPLTMTIDAGNLNSADYWSVYGGSCGGTLLGSFAGTSGVLFPQGSTTFYVRGEPHCVTPQPCVNIAVTVIPVDSSVTISGGTITAVSSAGTYEWLNCEMGYSVIPGETGQSFAVTSNGSYAMKISENGCVDTSSCYTFTSAGIENEMSNAVLIYPNPANDHVTIKFPGGAENGYVTLSDLDGRILLSQTFENAAHFKLLPGDLANGIYLMTIETASIHVTQKITLF